MNGMRRSATSRRTWRAFTPRRLEQTGFTSYRARAVAARNSRDAKKDEKPEALIHRWLDELDEIGFAPSYTPTRRLGAGASPSR